MKKLFRLLSYDLRQGFHHNRNWFLVELLMSAFLAFYGSFCVSGDSLIPTFTWVDVPGFLLKGVPIAQDAGAFQVPIVWLFLLTLILALVAAYPKEELRDAGLQSYIRSGSPALWWFGKCLWMMITTAAAWLLFYAICFVAACLMGATPRFGFSSQAMIYVLGTNLSVVSAEQLLFTVFLMPFFVTLALGMTLLCLTMFMDASLAYFLLVSYLFFGVLFVHPALIGNFAMMCRYDWGSWMHTVTLKEGLVVCPLLFLGTFFLGYWKLRNYNFLKKV